MGGGGGMRSEDTQELGEIKEACLRLVWASHFLGTERLRSRRRRKRTTSWTFWVAFRTHTCERQDWSADASGVHTLKT